MNFVTIAIVTFISSIFLYMIFLVLGFGGISQNRRVQGFDQNKTTDKYSIRK